MPQRSALPILNFVCPHVHLEEPKDPAPVTSLGNGDLTVSPGTGARPSLRGHQRHQLPGGPLGGAEWAVHPLGLGVRWALQVLCLQPAGGEDSGEVTVTSTRFHWQECTPGRAATCLTRATSGAHLAVGNCVHLRWFHSTSTPTSSVKLVTEAPVCPSLHREAN